MGSLQMTVIFLAMLFTIYIQPIRSQETVIVSGPSDQDVEQYSPVLMSCSVRDWDFKTQVISWVIGDAMISNDGKIDADALDSILGDGESERYEIFLGIKGNLITLELNISSAQGVDNGREYGCVVCGRNSDGICNGRFQLESERARLDVNYRPDTTIYPFCNSFLPEHEESYATENRTTVVLGQSVILNCTSETAKPPVILTWLKNNVDIEGTASESGEFSYLHHQFTAVLSDNNAIFRCNLHSNYFDLDAECALPPVKVVSYPKVVIESPGAVPAGETHSFICTASSNTTSTESFTYSWSWDPTYSKPEANTTKYGSVLSVDALSEDDGDKITCTVTDIDGMEASAVAKIQIQSKLSIGAIVGIVAAGIFCIGLILLVIFLVVKKKNKSKKAKKEAPQPSAVPMLPSSIKPAEV